MQHKIGAVYKPRQQHEQMNDFWTGGKQQLVVYSIGTASCLLSFVSVQSCF
jgi:hypothetical protein